MDSWSPKITIRYPSQWTRQSRNKMKVEIPLKKDFPIILLEKIPRRFFFRPSDENVICDAYAYLTKSIINKLHHGCQHFFIDIRRENVFLLDKISNFGYFQKREQYGYMFNIAPLSCLKTWRGCKSNYFKSFEHWNFHRSRPLRSIIWKPFCCCSGFGSHKKETRVDIINL